VTTPAPLRGLRRAGRERNGFQVSCPAFVVTGKTEEQLRAAAADIRNEVAFYGSTPAYRKVLDLHGSGDLHVLRTFAVVAPLSESTGALLARCDGVIDRVLPAFPAGMPEDAVEAVLDEVRTATSAGQRQS